MKGARFFSKIDMASAYWAVPIREQDREKTVCYTPRWLLEMCVNGYVLCNSQPTYQRIMDEALVDLKQVDSFVDNVCQYSSTFDEMMERLRENFEWFQKSNFQKRVEKCKFGYYEVDFVGHHISAEGVRPVSENVQDVLNFQPPTNIKELEQFLGMVNYYRKFVPNMARTEEFLN